MWASAQANKSGYLRETFRPAYNKILCGPGKQLRRRGNWEFPSRKRSASPRWEHFHTAWKKVAGAGPLEPGSGGTARAEKSRQAPPGGAPRPAHT